MSEPVATSASAEALPEDLAPEITPYNACDLIQSSRYSEALIPQLERYVSYQQAHDVYDFRANQHLLKLYRVYRATHNVDVVGLMLARAMCFLPERHFIYHTLLLPEKVQHHHQIGPIMHVYELLQEGKYDALWAHIQATGIQQPGFAAGLRRFMLRVISRTYRDIAVSDLDRLLGTHALTFLKSDPDLEVRWEVAGDTLRLRNTAETDDLGSKNIARAMPFRQLNPIFAMMQPEGVPNPVPDAAPGPSHYDED